MILINDWDKPAITVSAESPIPAMRAAGEILFNCAVRLNTGEWFHFDAGQHRVGYQHVEGDGGYAAREAQAMWGGL